MFTNGFGWPHVLIIAALLVILFGARRLPDAARGVGRSMRIFRSEMRGLHEDDDSSASQGQPTNTQGQAGPAQIAPQPPAAPPQQHTPSDAQAQRDQQT
ncbi:MAG TPA: Sec-independent protein translocase subunit TatA [Pseudonocardiaceae bacterium]|nr:Sec-independent protein translocase subunit TatA [Pseudonocardiaceae bacterium]